MSIIYKKDEAYVIPRHYLDFFVPFKDKSFLVVSLVQAENSFDNCSIKQICLEYSSKIHKKIVWDLIKNIDILIKYVNKNKLVECPDNVKMNIVRGLGATTNSITLSKSTKEIYRDFITKLNLRSGVISEIKIVDVVISSTNPKNYVLIPCWIKDD